MSDSPKLAHALDAVIALLVGMLFLVGCVAVEEGVKGLAIFRCTGEVTPSFVGTIAPPLRSDS